MESDSSSRPRQISGFIARVIRLLATFVGGLAATRIAYELFFPRLLWLGRPLPAFTLAIGFTLIFELLSRRFSRSPLHPLTLSPLFLNLIYLFDPTVDLVQSRFLFAASLWLTAVLLTNEQMARGKWQGKNILLLLAALLPVYLLTMSRTVGRADTFEFQVLAPQLGIAHPTGYPLYLILGKLFTFIPLGSMAWRLNLGTAVFASTALIILYQLGHRLFDNRVSALFGAVALGLTPTFWSQAIEAEVYSLHALIIAAALLVIQVASGKWRVANDHKPFTSHNSLFIIHYLLFLLIGLGLTNHLTTVFLIPPALLALFFTYRIHHSSFTFQHLLKIGLAFVLPLSLYAYLPIRWAAVNGEAMGVGRFLDWVIGGRFQGALQWDAWLRDPTRYAIVGRLFLDNWGWINLAVAFIGLIYLFIKKRQMALILFLTWVGYTFYNLNYYVPDLAVFLIPAQIVVAVWWLAGVTAVLEFIKPQKTQRSQKRKIFSVPTMRSVAVFLSAIPVLLPAAANWSQIDRSQEDGLTKWGRGVMAMPLAHNAAILADSEKIAPLYYLQQAEGMRPDLDIMVLPDEAAYRAELDSRIAAGQTVYLARFLPGLEGIYHLRSQGPLTEVSTQPLTELPVSATPINLDFEGIRLLGYELEPEAAVDEKSTAVTLYWRKNNQQSTVNNQLVYIRWNEISNDTLPTEFEFGRDNQQAYVSTGQHPANNYYPILAWDTSEIVSDFYLLPHPISSKTQQFNLQVALAPPFSPETEIMWQNVTAVWGLENPIHLPNPTTKSYAQIGEIILNEASFPSQIRPQDDLNVQLTGWGNKPNNLRLSMRPSNQQVDDELPLEWTYPFNTSPFFLIRSLNAENPSGTYDIYINAPQHGSLIGGGDPPVRPASYCGWLQPASDGCVLGQVEISGVPLPEGATNYNDKIALLNIYLPQTELQPGGQFSVTLNWQSLAPIDEDYTVFIQILDANDRIVGQVDAWPLQGTLPTSQWTPGETITDPYLIWLDSDLPAGQYRLIVGWYLLADLRRLPVLDESGQAIDDKLLVPGLFVP